MIGRGKRGPIQDHTRILDDDPIPRKVGVRVRLPEQEMRSEEKEDEKKMIEAHGSLVRRAI
jgi:hypothetical protein